MPLQAFVPVAFGDARVRFALPRLQRCFIRLHEALACIDAAPEDDAPRHEDVALREYVVVAAGALAHEGNRIAVALPEVLSRHPTPSELDALKKIAAETSPAMFGVGAPKAAGKKSASAKKKGGKPKKRRPKASGASSPTEKELDAVLLSFEKCASDLVAGVQQYCRGHSRTFASDVQLAAKRLLDSCGCGLLAAVPAEFHADAPEALGGGATGASAAASSSAPSGRSRGPSLAAMHVVQASGMVAVRAKAFEALPKHDMAAVMRRLIGFAKLVGDATEALWGARTDPPDRPTPAALRDAGPLLEEDEAEAEEDEGEDGGREFTDADFDDWDEDDEDDDDEDDGDDDDGDGAAARGAAAARGRWSSDARCCERWWRCYRSLGRLRKVTMRLDAMVVHASKTFRSDLAPWRPELGGRRAAAAAAAAASGAGSASGEPSRRWWLVRMGEPARRELELRYAWADGVADALDGASDALITLGDATGDPADVEALREGAAAAVAAVGALVDAALPGASPPEVRQLRDAAAALLPGAATGRKGPPAVSAAVRTAARALGRARWAALGLSVPEGDAAAGDSWLDPLLVPGSGDAERLRAGSLASSSAGVLAGQATEEVDLDAAPERDDGEATFDVPETEPEAARAAAATLCKDLGLPAPSFEGSEDGLAEAALAGREAAPAPDSASREHGGSVGALPLEQQAIQCLLADAACADPMTAWNLGQTALVAMRHLAGLVRELDAAGLGHSDGGADANSEGQEGSGDAADGSAG